MIARLLFIGFSGTGKSTTGRLVAHRVGWRFVDMDDLIEQRAGLPIPEIFAQHGEAWFRQQEAALLAELLTEHEIVVATGGGAVCTDDAWAAIANAPDTLTVCLEATDDEIIRRIQQQTADDGRTTQRPMLSGNDPLGRIRQLLIDRRPYYDRANIRLDVDQRPPDQTAADLAEMLTMASGTPSEIRLEAPTGHSRILVGEGVRAQLPALIHDRWPTARRLWIAADEHVARLHASWIATMEHDLPAAVQLLPIPSGEGSKSLHQLSALYDWFIAGSVERGDVVIALGGGVVGDLAGFAAATILRGIGLVQIPTTLLAMVDSSVGGKTGINHPGGKNLIGAFYQPPLVVVDPVFLQTLPSRELHAGFAEVVKHSVIQASVPGAEAERLYGILERNAEALRQLTSPLTPWTIRQNISLKAAVVTEDEQEAGLRQILNFGHTIGHGIEAAGYHLMHGEAVAVGMIAAMHIAVGMGLVSPDQLTRLATLLTRFGLPTRTGFDRDTVIARMQADKKKAAGTQRWVLPRAEGGVQIRTDVLPNQVHAALQAVHDPQAG